MAHGYLIDRIVDAEIDRKGAYVYDERIPLEAMTISADYDRFPATSENDPGNWETGPQVLLPRNRGLVYSGYRSDIGDECIYWRIWFYPAEVDAGFIVEEQEHDIYIWNADILNNANVSSVGETSVDGLDLDYTVPVTLPPNSEFLWTLTVYTVGPATQDSYYRPVVDGDTYEMHVTGIRLLAITPEPNWGSPPRIKYTFHTVIAVNKYFKEQRRPLLITPRRNITAEYILTDLEAQDVFNRLSFSHDKVMGVPIYNEKMYATSLAAGLTRIVFTESHEYLWNFNNLAAYVMLVDHENRAVLIKTIDEIDSTTSVVLTTELQSTFDAGTTTVYPMLAATIRSLSFGEETTNVQRLLIEYEEYING